MLMNVEDTALDSVDVSARSESRPHTSAPCQSSCRVSQDLVSPHTAPQSQEKLKCKVSFPCSSHATTPSPNQSPDDALEGR